MAHRKTSKRRKSTASSAYVPNPTALQANSDNSSAAFDTEFSREHYGKKGGKRPQKGHTGLAVFLVILIILLAGVGYGAYNAYQLYQSAMHVRAQASEAIGDLDTIKSCIVSGDTATAQQKAQELTKKAKAMNEETDGPLWVFAEKIPVYGEDIATVRTLTDVFDDVSENAIVPLCEQMSGVSLKTLIGDDNAINVDQLSQLVDTLSSVAPVLQRSADAFNKCPTPHLEQLKSIINKASTQLNNANDLFAFANRFAPLVPNVLGANGSRSYLIIAQNNVEARATGGFYGQVGMMTIDNGSFSVEDFAGTAASSYNKAYKNNKLRENYEPIEIVGFPDVNLQDMGTNPDIPHVAEVFYDACEAAGRPVDGIFFVDPVFVQYLVGLTGGFTASDGTWIDGSNVATVLMHDTYWNYVNNNSAQNEFFTMIANDALHNIFSSLGNVDLKEFAETVTESTKTRHLSLWFANPDEEAAVDEFGFTGSVSNDPTKPVAGIYFTNESWSKMEWYLRAAAEITSEVKNDDGSVSYGVALYLTNTITNEEALSGNWYVTADETHGNHKIMYQPGDMLERVIVCAPAGGSISDIWVDGDIYDREEGTIYGLQASRHNVHILPGQTVTFTYTVTTAPEAKKELTFDVTPLAQDALDESEDEYDESEGEYDESEGEYDESY